VRIGDWALLFGLLVNAVAVIIGMRSITKKVDVGQNLVNGRMTQLIEEVRASGIAKGRKDEKDEQELKHANTTSAIEKQS
jgi:hypothetical protein